MRTGITILLLATFLAVPAAAQASLAAEERQGQDVIAQLRAGGKSCSDLSAEDFDHIAEYVVRRAVGSTALHQMMNGRMSLMMGAQGELRMHQLLGQRYAGCSSNAGGGAGYGGMMGPGMMGGYYRSGGWGAMMGSRDWSWMMGGAWQNMSRQDWHRLQQRLLDTSAGSSRDRGGWSPVAIIAPTLGALALVGLAVALAIRRPFRRPPASAASHR
ncbi:MAG: hypothetical protein ACXVRN_02545 [Solirubrobacteraceae bacterium]